MTAQSGLGFSGIVAIQIPDDGATGEVLTKLTPDNYDYDWAAGGGAVTVDPGTVDDSILRWNTVTPAWEEFLAYIFPLVDGTAQQIIETDGAGTLSFVDPQAGGGLLSAEYRFSTSIVSADPGSGRYRFDTASYATVTEIFIDDETSGGVDISNLLTQIGLGDRLYFQVKTESNKFVVFDVTGPAVDNVGWFTIPVDDVVFGDFFANNDRCILIWSVGGTPETLQTAYNEDPTVPQIVVNATPEPVTIDASVVGSIFAVRDSGAVEVIEIADTGVTLINTEFVAQTANPSGTPAVSMYLDDGTNFIANTLVWGDLTSPMLFSDDVGIGDPGTEQGGVNVGGVNFNATAKINDFGGTVDAMLVLHRHSTSFGSNLVLSRSNSDTAAHAALTAGQVISQMVNIGWSGTHYDIATIMQTVVPTGTTISPTSLAGQIEFYTTPDLSNTALIAMIIGSDQIIYGGTAVGETLTLRGSQDAALGFLEFDSPMNIDFDYNDTSVFDIITYDPVIPSSGGAVTSFILMNPDITIDSGLFIASTVRELGTYRQTVAPGFAVQTVFLGQPTLETTTAAIQPNQSFMFASQALYENDGAGAVATHVPNVIGVTHLPRLGARVAGDTLSVTNWTGIQVGANFATVAGTTIDFGTIRGVLMVNPAVGLFQPGAGIEGMDAMYGLDMPAIPFDATAFKAAVRSQLVAGAITRFLWNLGTAESEFGAGDIHLNDNTSVKLGNTITAPDMLLFWTTGTSALRFSPFFGTGGNPLDLTASAADEWVFQADVGGFGDIGIGFDVNAIVFGGTAPTPNSNNWFVQFSGASGRQVQIGGEYSDVLWTASGFIDVNGQAVSDLQAFKINSPSVVLNGGTIADLSNLYVAAMPSFGGTRMQALRVLGRSRLDGLMTHNEETLAQLTADVAALALPANNLGRFVLLQDADALGPWTIQGIVNVQVGDSVYFINDGANAWDFGHEDAGAAAADRIITPTAATWTLGAREFAKLWYDPVATRWRILESNGA